jgi:hypothetical protein
MRAYDQGCYYRVCVSEREVYEWKRSWPCSGLPDAAISFTFDKGNGDLVDLHPDLSGSTYDAACALADDAQAYGRKRLGLELG